MLAGWAAAAGLSRVPKYQPWSFPGDEIALQWQICSFQAWSCPAKHTSSPSWVMCPWPCAAAGTTTLHPLPERPSPSFRGLVLSKSPPQFPPEQGLLQQTLNHLRLPKAFPIPPSLSSALAGSYSCSAARQHQPQPGKPLYSFTSTVAIAGETLPKNLLKSCLESGSNCLWIAALKPRLSILPSAWFTNGFLVWLSPPLMPPPHTSAISSFFHEQALRGSAHL